MQPKQYSINIPDDFSSAAYHTMVYYEWGDPQAEKIMICVHGLSRNGRDFDSLAKMAAQHSYRVLSVDIVGRGLSPWLEDYSRYSYETYVSDMLYFIETLKLQAVEWIGTSMGGIIGMIAAEQVPEYFKRLVINDIGPFIPGKAMQRIMDYVGSQPSFKDRAAIERYIREILSPFVIHHEEHWQHLFQHAITERDGHYCLAYDPAIATAIKEAFASGYSDIDLWPIWKQLPEALPILILHGELSDILTPTILDRMVQRSNSSAIRYPNIGHAPALMDATQIGDILHWLGNQA